MMHNFPAVPIVKDEDGNPKGLEVSGRYASKWAKALNEFSKKGFVQVVLKAPEKPGTEQQRKAFHALCDCFWRSGCSSFQTYEDLRNKMKTCRDTQAVESFYIAAPGKLAFWSNQYPADLVGASIIACLPKSWTDMTLAERKRSISFILDEMDQAQVASSHMSKRFAEIVDGMRSTYS